jgi:hypothetical protein
MIPTGASIFVRELFERRAVQLVGPIGEEARHASTHGSDELA